MQPFCTRGRCLYWPHNNHHPDRIKANITIQRMFLVLLFQRKTSVLLPAGPQWTTSTRCRSRTSWRHLKDMQKQPRGFHMAIVVRILAFWKEQEVCLSAALTREQLSLNRRSSNTENVLLEVAAGINVTAQKGWESHRAVSCKTLGEMETSPATYSPPPRNWRAVKSGHRTTSQKP